MESKKFLSEVLDYYKYKLDNNLCTMEEIDSVAKTLEKNLEIKGTISDFAKFYGVPENSVRVNINRKMLAKPERKVFYSFLKFLRIVPEKWSSSRNGE